MRHLGENDIIFIYYIIMEENYIFRMDKIKSLLEIGCYNEKVNWLVSSKKNYELKCKEVDDVFIEIEKMNDGREIDDLILKKLRPLKNSLEMAYNLYTSNEKSFGNLVRDDSLTNLPAPPSP